MSDASISTLLLTVRASFGAFKIVAKTRYVHTTTEI